jgi:agmatine deiminase
VIPDDQSNTVFISDLLAERHPEIEGDLRAELSDRLQLIPGTNDIWCRDYMPVQLESDRIIPKEPDDKIGHADGMVRLVNDRTALVNDYRHVDRAFGQRLAKALARFEIIPFPYCPCAEVIDGIDSAEGVYINFLQVQGTIFLPIFGQPSDDEALSRLSNAFQGTRIVPVRANELARGGGVLNCATWGIRVK